MIDSPKKKRFKTTEDSESTSENLPFDEIVNLNVGGYKYSTSISTLQARGGINFLSILVGNDREGKIPAKRDKEGNIWIDRNGKIFGIILEYLRTGKLFIPSKVSKDQIEVELDFYQIKDLDLKEEMKCDPEMISFYEMVDKQASKIRNSATKWVEANQSKIFTLMKTNVREDSPKTEVTLHFHLDYSRTSPLGTPWVCDTRVSLILPPEYVPPEPTVALNSAWMRMLCHIISSDWHMNCRFFCSGGPPNLQLILDWSPLICPPAPRHEEVHKILQSFYLDTSSKSVRF